MLTPVTDNVSILARAVTAKFPAVRLPDVEMPPLVIRLPTFA